MKQFWTQAVIAALFLAAATAEIGSRDALIGASRAMADDGGDSDGGDGGDSDGGDGGDSDGGDSDGGDSDGGDSDGGDSDSDGPDQDGDDDAGDDDDQDDADDDDDDDDDDDEDEVEPSDGAATASDPVVRGEILAFGLSPADIAALERAGYTLRSTEEIPLVGGAAHRFTTRSRLDPFEEAERARAIAPNGDFSAHHVFRPSQSETRQRYPLRMISAKGGACGVSSRIGIIDTLVAPQHPALDGVRLVTSRFPEPQFPIAASDHGTAVASILAGRGTGGAPLLDLSELYVADAFHQGDDGVEATALAVVRALDWLVSQDVRIIGLSLSGGDNALLRRATSAALARGVILIAAVGNDQLRGAPRYPAAYDGVIGVTAIDRRRRVYRNANQGAYVDFAAPGVDVWGGGGDAYVTGTSFATPFVVAALAAAKNEGRDGVVERLRRAALDLGPEGRDDVYGWGLVQLDPKTCK